MGALGSRYEVYGEIAAGGMASVQYGRLLGPRGFSRAVAIKRLHAHFRNDPEFVAMFLDEARLSARLVHANIVHTLDIIDEPDELALVMEYVLGESLWSLMQLARAADRAIPVRVGCALIVSVLHGLSAAHDARDDAGQPLHIVHRDVSPQNILVASDGVPRLLDFGIAKALGRMRTTPQGEIKGKLSYISCEQLQAKQLDGRADIYGAAVVLWEVLTGLPLFDGPSESAIVHRVLYDEISPPSAYRPDEIPRALDQIVLKALNRSADARYASAQEMALALEQSVGVASQFEVAAWLRELAGERLAKRAQLLTSLQDDTTSPGRAAEVATGTRKVQRPAIQSDVQPGVIERVPVNPIAATLPAISYRSRSRTWLTGAMIALTVLMVVVFWLRSREQPRASLPLTAAEPVPVPAPVVTPVPPLPAASEPVVVDTSSPKVAPSAAKRATPARTRASAHKHEPAATAAPDDRCTPFYEVDAKGIRRPKPECL